MKAFGNVFTTALLLSVLLSVSSGAAMERCGDTVRRDGTESDAPHTNAFTPIALPVSATNVTAQSFYSSFPTPPNTELGGVPFVLDGTASPGFMSTDPRPETTVPVDVPAAVAVHLLLNAYSTDPSYAGQVLGTVRLQFNVGDPVELPLRMGQNVRDWAPVSSGPYANIDHTTDGNTVEVFHDANYGVVDKVTVLAGAVTPGRRLTAVTVRDDSPGSTSAGILWFGLTVERLAEIMTYTSHGNVYVAEVSGENARALTAECSTCDHPTLSPDGRTAVFVSRSAEGHWLISAADVQSGRACLLLDAGTVTRAPRPRFTADGARIMFHMTDTSVTTRAGHPTKLFSLAVDGSEAQAIRVTKSGKKDEANAAPGPDGTIAFISGHRLRRMQPDGRRQKTLFYRAGAAGIDDPDEPAFSADGKRIVFGARVCRGATCSRELFAINVDRTGLVQLTTELQNAASPALTPDSKTIVAAARGSIWAMTEDGSDQRPVVDDATSPGTRLVNQLPAGCYEPHQAYVCYRPYRAQRSTMLRTGPSPTAPPVVFNGSPVALPANTAFGASSVRASSCQTTPGPRPVEGSPPYRWGYIAKSETAVPARGRAGWVAVDDLADAADVLGLCGPEDADYQCGLPQTACPQARSCVATGMMYPNLGNTECNIAAADYARLSPAPTASARPGPATGWLLPYDHFVTLRAAYAVDANGTPSDTGWKCVSVSNAQAINPVPFNTWIWAPGVPPAAWCGGAHCGNGVKEGTEECDDGNQDPCDGCTNTCRLPKCGDGIACSNRGEECDDGDSENGDGCDGNCKTTRCGNGALTPPGSTSYPPEDCDDGILDGTYCDRNCSKPVCGNGIVDASAHEQCDMGGRCVAGTKQGAACTHDVECPGVDPQTDPCRPFNTTTCDAECRVIACHNGGPPQPGEACEDGYEYYCNGLICSNCTCNQPPPPTGDCWYTCNNSTSWQNVGTWVEEWQCAQVYLCGGRGGVKNRLWYPYGDVNQRHCLKIGCYDSRNGCNFTTCSVPGCACSN